MNNIANNRSDNSLNKSVARSSSGVSTQQSADGIEARDGDADCQILYGNCFAKLPHPETVNDQSRRISFTEFNNFLETCSINNELDGSLAKSSKPRRYSEAQSRTFGKFKFNSNKNKAESSSKVLNPSNNKNVERLVQTISNIIQNKPPHYFDSAHQVFTRNPAVPMPSLQPQNVIHAPPQSKVLEKRWNDLEEALIHLSEHKPKQVVFCQLDPNNSNPSKLPNTSILTYHKLYQRAQRVAYHLLYKLSSVSIGPISTSLATGGDVSMDTSQLVSGVTQNLRVGQSVALLFNVDTPIDFLVAMSCCMVAKVIGVPIEKPSFSGHSGHTISTGKYLTQLSVNVVLTTQELYRELTRKEADIREIWPWNGFTWVLIDTLYSEKCPKTFVAPQACSTFEAPLYVEFSLIGDSEQLFGLPITQKQIIEHCRSLECVCGYEDDQVLMCTDDVRRLTGLWHSVFMTIYCGMTCYYWPLSQIKKSPSHWLNAISKLKVINLVTSSRALHQTLSVDEKTRNSSNFSSLRNLLVSDAHVPWINETLDHFISTFSKSGITESSILLCISQPQTLSICTARRTNQNEASQTTTTNQHQVNLSQEALSYRLLKEPMNSEELQTSICVDTIGQLLPGISAILIPIPMSTDESMHNEVEKKARLCKTDELGEICVSSSFSTRAYWMTPDDITMDYLTVPPEYVGVSDTPHLHYIRTGLIGFFRNDLVYVVGSLWKHVEVQGRLFNSDDVIGTVSAVNPSGILYKARCCVFTVPVLQHPQLVIAAEINASASKSDVYEWISRVLNSVLRLHRLTVYGVVGLQPNSFPKTILGDINVEQTRQKFLHSLLPISHLLLAPQSSLPNILPIQQSPSHNSTAAAGPKLQHNLSLLAHAVNSPSFASIGHNSQPINNNSTETISQSDKRIMSLPEVLEWRATHTPADIVFSIYGPKMNVLENVNYEQLMKRSEKLANYMKDRCDFTRGGNLAAIMTHNLIEQISAVFACYHLELTPLVLSPPTQVTGTSQTATDASHFRLSLLEKCWAVRQSHAIGLLVSNTIMKQLKSRESSFINLDQWNCPVIDMSSCSKTRYKHGANNAAHVGRPALARVQGDESHLGIVTWSHEALSNICGAISESVDNLLPQTKCLLLFPESHNDFATSHSLLFWSCIMPVYSGIHVNLQCISSLDTAPTLWIDLITHKNMKFLVCSEDLLWHAISNHNTTTAPLYKRAVVPSLSSLHTILVTHPPGTRPSPDLFDKFFDLVRMKNWSPSGSLDIRPCLEAYCVPGCFMLMNNEQANGIRHICLDRTSLRNNRLVETQESDQKIELLESGKPLNNTKLIVVDPKSRCQKATNQIGEIWIQSVSSTNHFVASIQSESFDLIYSSKMFEMDPTAPIGLSDTQLEQFEHDKLSARLQLGESLDQSYTRTDLIGFVRNYGVESNAVVLGNRNEVLQVRGISIFPCDLENLLLESEPKFISNCMVFSDHDLLVAVVEVATQQYARHEVCFRKMPQLMTHVVEYCSVPLSIVTFVNPGQLTRLLSNGRQGARLVKSLWLRRQLEGPLQIYSL